MQYSRARGVAGKGQMKERRGRESVESVESVESRVCGVVQEGVMGRGIGQQRE